MAVLQVVQKPRIRVTMVLEWDVEDVDLCDGIEGAVELTQKSIDEGRLDLMDMVGWSEVLSAKAEVAP